MAKDNPMYDLSNPNVVKLWTAFLKNAEGIHIIRATKVKDQRSAAQNAYMWGVVLPRLAAGLTEAFGVTFDSDMAHDYGRKQFLKMELVNQSDGVVSDGPPRSTASLTVEEFTVYLEKLIALCEYLGVEVPPADRREWAA